MFIDLDYLITGKVAEEEKAEEVIREKETIIIKEKDHLSDVRTIQMVRDNFWFWNDKTVNFNYNITYTI